MIKAILVILLAINTAFSQTSEEQEKKSEPIRFEYVRVLPERNINEVKALLFLYLKENDLKVWKEIESKSDAIRYSIIYSCSEKHLRSVIESYPRLGNIFPCRILVKEDGEGNVILSIINAEILLRVYKGVVPNEVLDLIKENYEYLKTIIDQL